MTNTLVVHYTPRKGSYTKVLLDEFLSLAKDETEITELDLAKMPPDLLLIDNLNLIVEWSNGKRDFSNLEQAILANHRVYVDQLLRADYIVLAFPIYNFSMPATVKAWIDAIVVSEKTFAFKPEIGFIGLCNSKKAVSIIVSGFDYSTSNTVKEYATTTIQQNFEFMGMDSEHILAFGVDQNRAQLTTILEQAKLEIKSLVNKWFVN